MTQRHPGKFERAFKKGPKIAIGVMCQSTANEAELQDVLHLQLVVGCNIPLVLRLQL